MSVLGTGVRGRHAEQGERCLAEDLSQCRIEQLRRLHHDQERAATQQTLLVRSDAGGRYQRAEGHDLEPREARGLREQLASQR